MMLGTIIAVVVLWLMLALFMVLWARMKYQKIMLQLAQEELVRIQFYGMKIKIHE